MNIFSKEYNTKFNSTPFSKINTSDYLPAFEQGIKVAEQEIVEIINNTEIPNFKNVIEALDDNETLLTKVIRVFFGLLGSMSSPEKQKIAQDVSPKLSKLYNDKILNAELFKKVKFVYENKNKESLTEEQETLLKEIYRDFVRNGANLNEEDRAKLRTIDSKLSTLSLKFGNNVLAEINKYELHITDKNDLAGLPESVLDAAKMTAKQKNKDGWVFTLDGPSYTGFMGYADNRELRKTLHKAFTTKCNKGDEFDNKENIKDILLLRFERANLLGYKDHASFQLEQRMALNSKTVFSFLEDLLSKTINSAKEEYIEICEFSEKLGGPKKVATYDTPYYSKKLKKEKFDLDDQQLKPYFKLDNVVKGAFLISEKLYGLQFEEIFDIDKYHPDVQTYKVTDEKGDFVSLFYADYFPRESKQNGAWMSSFQGQYKRNGVNYRPHIMNVCNFTKPTETKPSLLTFGEVVTLFHEFGHGLHGMLANTKYKQLSGTRVFGDFVELPSQIFENWCFEKEALSLFAFHYETGDVIPDELIDKIKKSATYREASKMLRQLSFATLDMKYHTLDPKNLTDVKSFEVEHTKTTTVIANEDYTLFSAAFGHIFQGGYSAGYYSYKWAEVLDADAFELFKEKGIFNRDLGEKFKETILSKGGTRHPMELYKDFRGAEPDNTALLKRSGLLSVKFS